MAQTLIHNGRLVSPTGVEAADVLVEGETIAAIGAPGFFADAATTALLVSTRPAASNVRLLPFVLRP